MKTKSSSLTFPLDEEDLHEVMDKFGQYLLPAPLLQYILRETPQVFYTRLLPPLLVL
jgi:hypothetical protein